MSDYSFWTDAKLHDHPDQLKRMERALSVSDPQHIDEENKTCQIRGSDRVMYLVTLSLCSCPDFHERRLPCKHMYKFAYEMDVFPLTEVLMEAIGKNSDAAVAEINAIEAEMDEVIADIDSKLARADEETDKTMKGIRSTIWLLAIISLMVGIFTSGILSIVSYIAFAVFLFVAIIAFTAEMGERRNKKAK